MPAGLTPAIFLDSTGKEVPSPDPAAGLHIKTRSGRIPCRQQLQQLSASHCAL